MLPNAEQILVSCSFGEHCTLFPFNHVTKEPTTIGNYHCFYRAYICPTASGKLTLFAPPMEATDPKALPRSALTEVA